MKHAYKVLRDSVYQNPLALLAIEDKKLLKIANGMLPFSVGCEFEYRNNPDKFQHGLISGDKKLQKDLGLIHVCTGLNESRFRIPSGIKGMIALYNLCEWLKENQELNTGSGIHYHIDFTDVYNKINNRFHLVDFCKAQTYNWVLKSLDSWNYEGSYNSRHIDFVGKSSVWICNRPEFKTFEVRIGDMSFDYEYFNYSYLTSSSYC